MNRIVIRFVSGNTIDFELEDKNLRKLDRDLTKYFGARFEMNKYGYTGNYTINTQTIETWSFVDSHDNPVKIWED